ncbi:MAG: cupin domain-containing protein [Actinomycetota bacterium]
MATPRPIDLTVALGGLGFLPDRTPTTEDSSTDWAAQLASYRDGGIFAVHYAGQSEWERHGAGDEIVMVLEGATTMTMLVDGVEHELALGPMQLVVVPRGTWHRFVTPTGAKIVTVTPQPTDHRVEHPAAG